MKKLLLVIFLLFLIPGPNLWARSIVVSDIDDTIRKSDTLFAPSALRNLIKLNVEAYEGIRSYYWLLWGKGAEFLYVSSSYNEIYDARSWLLGNQFPFGSVEQRSRENIETETEYDFKVKAILSQLRKMNVDENDDVYFFGDTSWRDEESYLKVVEILHLKKSHIYIRDVDGQTTFLLMTIPVKQTPGVHYYFADDDLIDMSNPLFFKEAPLELFWGAYKQFLKREEIEQSPTFKRQMTLMEKLCPKGSVVEFNCSVFATIESMRLKKYLELKMFPKKFIKKTTPSE